MKQLTFEQAALLFTSREWLKWDDVDLLYFQLFQKHIGVGYDEVINALKTIMEKPTWTTKDFCSPNMEKLQRRFLKKVKREPPELSYFRKLIPREKRILIFHTPIGEANYALNKLNQKEYHEKNKIKRTKKPSFVRTKGIKRTR